LLEELKQVSKQNNTFSFQISLIYIALNDLEKAMEYLEMAYLEQGSNMAYLKIDPYLNPLRSSAKFKSLLKRMGLN